MDIDFSRQTTRTFILNIIWCISQDLAKNADGMQMAHDWWNKACSCMMAEMCYNILCTVEVNNLNYLFNQTLLTAEHLEIVSFNL